MKKSQTNFSSYRDDIDYMEDHLRVIDLLVEEKEKDPLALDEEKSQPSLPRKIKQLWKRIHERRQKSLQQGKRFALDRIVGKNRLSRLEKKILIFLLHRHFSSSEQTTSARTILDTLTNNRVEFMRFRHCLSAESKLRKNQLVISHNEEEASSQLEEEFFLSEETVASLLGEKQPEKASHKIGERSYRAYLQLYFSLVQDMEKKADIVSELRWEIDEAFEKVVLGNKQSSRELRRLKQSIGNWKKKIKSFKGDRENYPLEQVAKEYSLSENEKLILIILLRDSLGLSDAFMGCEGKKILAIISDSEKEMISNRPLLYKGDNLRSNNLIQMEKGSNGHNILESDYYLSEKMIRKLLGDLPGDYLQDDELQESSDDSRLLSSLDPRIGFKQVILPAEKKEAIEVALSQLQNQDLIFETWGFKEKIPYGIGLTMLFSGPPGTGKTLMAEAIAHALNKKLFIANYSQIQNMYVGETEKRIVSAFKAAKEQDGVLLWDEADSMFYSREMAQQSWESRDVNIILQEIEKFSGVVILTTNRKVVLDKALERRISLKIEFELPDLEGRKAIWRELLPKKAPLATNVDIEKLAKDYPISGGLIKNAVLNAARYAAFCNAKEISMEDLIKGINIEMNGGWTKKEAKIGFAV